MGFLHKVYMYCIYTYGRMKAKRQNAEMLSEVEFPIYGSFPINTCIGGFPSWFVVHASWYITYNRTYEYITYNCVFVFHSSM